MATATVYVIGVNHGIQTMDEGSLWPLDNIAEIRRQRLHFRHLLETIFANGQIEFVGEEWGLPHPSTAQLLSNEKGIVWANINTSREDLHRMSIPHDYIHGNYDAEKKNRWNRHREEFMVDRIGESIGVARNLAVVCGLNHLEPIRQLLTDRGLVAQPVDYKAQPWYRGDVFSED